jgi:hypothetical protein
MFWLMLGAQVLSAAGGVIGRAQERNNAKAQIDQELAKLNLNAAQAVTGLENQKIVDKAQADAAAMDLGNETRAGQIQAGENLLGMRAEADAAAGNLAVGQAAGGIAGRTTVQNVLDENIQTAINTERERIETSVSGANMQIGEMRRSFQLGSAYMNSFEEKKSSILTSAAQQKSFLDDQRESYNYDFNWLAQDIFDVAGAAASFAGAAYKSDYWGNEKAAKFMLGDKKFNKRYAGGFNG